MPAQVRLKRDAEGAIEEALHVIQDQRREPDDWEGRHLAEAIGAVACRAYTLAALLARKALTPAAERAGEYPRHETTPSLVQLSHGLDAIAALPAPNA